MKKIIAVFIAFLFCFGSASAEPWRVFDSAGLFDEQEEEALEDAISTFQRALNLDFVVLTTDDYLGADATYDVAAFFYGHGPYGFGMDASGLIYYIDMFNRVPAIVTTGDAISALPEEHLDSVFNIAYPMLASGDYYEAVLATINHIQAIISDNDGKSNQSSPD